MTTERVRTVDGAALAVTTTGPSHAPVWLMAHGVGSSSRFLQDAMAAPVHAAGWRLASVDLRGHGDSDPDARAERHTPASHARDLSVVAAAVGATVVGGVSIGGHAAVLAAPTVGARAVVACLPAWTGATTPGVGPHAAVAALVAEVGVSGLVDHVAGDVDMAPWLRATVLQDFRRCDAESLAAALCALDGADGPQPHELASLPCPLAVVGWPDDPGHPLPVAEEWAGTAGGPIRTLAIADLDDDPHAMGAAAVAALAATGVSP